MARMGIRQVLQAWQDDQRAESRSIATMAQAMRISRIEKGEDFEKAIRGLTAI